MAIEESAAAQRAQQLEAALTESRRALQHARLDVARLKDQVEEQRQENEVLHEVSACVAAASSPHEMLASIAELAVRMTETDSSSIYIYDTARGELVLRAVHDASGVLPGRHKLKVGEGITGWVARELQPVALEQDAYKDSRFKSLPDLKDQRSESFLSVPMLVKGHVIGVLNVKTREPHRYPPRHVRVLSAIAAQAAAAMEGARLQESMNATQNQLSAISEVSRTLTSNLYLGEILQLIVAMTAQTMNFKICSIMLLDEERGELVIKATQSKSVDYLQKPNLKIGESVAGKALQEGRILTILDVKQAPEYRFPDIAQKEGLCSMVCVPLTVKSRRIGVLNCYTGKPHRFVPEELSLLEMLANYAAIAIENAKLMVRSAIIQEMHHRVKNSLQTVASLLRLQKHRIGTRPLEDILQESINRIVSIATVHDLLSQEDLDEVNIKRVAEQIITLNGQSLLRPDHRIEMRVQGEDVVLPSSKATSVALVLNELVHNAFEHGFQHEREGQLCVDIRTHDSEVALEVRNNGDPLPTDFDLANTHSLGLQIVAALAREDLGGEFTLRNLGETCARVSFCR